jgi:hypothetical protein
MKMKSPVELGNASSDAFKNLPSSWVGNGASGRARRHPRYRTTRTGSTIFDCLPAS